MTYQSSQEFESYVPVFDAIPEKWEDAREILIELLKKQSNAINIREIGWLLDTELLSGKQLFPGTSSSNDQQFRSVLRKVVNFGPLPNTANKQVPHGITIDANFTLTGLYACATDPIALNSFVIPHATVNPINTVQIFLDAININIQTLINYSAYTRVLVFIEYVQEI